MDAKQELLRLMSCDLPTINQQKRKIFRPTRARVWRIYRLLNEAVFDNKLKNPYIFIKADRTALGWCVGIADPKTKHSTCVIHLTDKFYSIQWLITVLAHEMCHQYQWDIQGLKRIRLGRRPLMSHGPSFFQYRDRLNNLGIPLHKKANIVNWFKHQDLKKL